MPNTHPTSAAKWSLVVHRVNTSKVEVWVGTLFPTMAKPDKARIILSTEDGTQLKTKVINSSDWDRPFRKHGQRFYFVHTFTGLPEASFFRLEFQRKEKASWQQLRRGSFHTLPSSLPGPNQRPFTIGLGSCFYSHRDGGQAAASYKALYERKQKIDLTILAGDQVYLDIGFDSLSLWPSEIRQRIADDYAEHWQALGSILSRGGTWMLPDDHEYWNDYPFYDSLIPTLLALKISHVRSNWKRASNDAVKNIQRTKLVDFLEIGDDLSICFADTRSKRKKSGFLPKDAFRSVTDWAENLESPGVLVTSQPLIVKPNDNEANLLSFETQYKKLLSALASSGHDIIVLSGDVHYGRIATAELGNGGGKLIEIISSPLSNLTGLNGIATSVAKAKPETFPHSSVDVTGVPSKAVDYDRNYFVGKKKGRLLSAYPKDRTREHFMTIEFSKNTAGKVKLAAKAWRVRDRAPKTNLPVQEFEKAFQVALN